MKWTKFSDQSPPDDKAHEYVYCTNYVKVWVSRWADFSVWSDTWWAPIEIPEVPKKTLHECVKGLYSCSENYYGKLIFHRLGMIGNIHVIYCPFCGYNPEKKDET